MTDTTRTSRTRPERPAGQDAPGDAASGPPAHGSGIHGRARRGADAVFRYLSTGAGLSIVVAVLLIGLFLLLKAYPSVIADKVNFLTSAEFNTTDATNLRFGIRDLLVVTVLSSLFGLLIAMPVALGIALFLTHYAPPALARPFGYLVDLLAAVPSIIFGLWGLLVLAPALVPLQTFLNTYLGAIPLFAQGNVPIVGGGTIFTAGVILAVMILPIITAVTREVFRQTPRTQIEGALALGATKWEMVRATVLPFGRSGFIAGSMLGLGRALGETIAVFIILKTSPTPAGLSLFDGGYTFATKIASAASEFSQPLPTGAYIAAGLVLFLLTFAVNAIARAIAGGKVNAG